MSLLQEFSISAVQHPQHLSCLPGGSPWSPSARFSLLLAGGLRAGFAVLAAAEACLSAASGSLASLSLGAHKQIIPTLVFEAWLAQSLYDHGCCTLTLR